MWSSGSSEDLHNNNDKSFSSSSTSCSYSSFSNPPALRNTTMEEVWRDINLSSLDGQKDTNNFLGRNLQDFLARPFSNTNNRPPLPTSNNLLSSDGAPVTLPATVLSLNSGYQFHFEPQVPISNIVMPFNGLDSSPSGFAGGGGGKKRFTDSDDSAGDQRHKRMIMNRESAARSRARKQAYTNELELKIANLREENARLRKQQQQLCVAAHAQLPKRRSLHRSASAPPF